MKYIKITIISVFLFLVVIPFPFSTYAHHECTVDDSCPGPMWWPFSPIFGEVPFPVLGVSAWPFIQLSRVKEDIMLLKFNNLYGVSERVWGLSVGVINRNGSVLGFELGGVNWTDQVTGLQLGVLNVAKEVNLLQAGVINLNGTTRGLQLGLFNSQQDGPFSLQFALVNFAAGATFLQVAPLVNVVFEDYANIQLGLTNYGNVQGFQVGGVNYAEEMVGLQVGVVNVVTKHLKGVQIGLINLSSGKGGLLFFPLINAGF